MRSITERAERVLVLPLQFRGLAPARVLVAAATWRCLAEVAERTRYLPRAFRAWIEAHDARAAGHLVAYVVRGARWGA